MLSALLDEPLFMRQKICLRYFEISQTCFFLSFERIFAKTYVYSAFLDIRSIISMISLPVMPCVFKTSMSEWNFF